MTGISTGLSVLGADDGGEGNLLYDWQTTGTPPAPVTFSDNNTNTAKSTIAGFSVAGTYTFLVTAIDSTGLSTTSSVTVTVNQTLTAITVSPGSAGVNQNGTQQFSAAGFDQFGNALATGPAFTWTTAGVGSINASGLYTAPGSGSTGSATITASSGAINGSASISVTNAAPSVATGASASPSPVTGTTTALSVLGADDGGEPSLTYTWTATGNPPAVVSFSRNGNNAAKNTVATFSQPGTYSFQVTITDAGGLTATSSDSVTVNLALATIAVTPATASLNQNQTRQFVATGYDQFGNALSTQPAFTWSVAGPGSVNSAGFFSAPGSGSTGSTTVTASSGSVSGSSTVAVTNATPTVAIAAQASPGAVTGTTTALSVLGADDGGEPFLVYTWAAVGSPPAAVSFSANGSNAAKNTTATFSGAGHYTLKATITDAGGLVATSSVSVTVSQTLASIRVSPASATMSENGSQQFTATGYDQFGVTMASQPAFTWTLPTGTGSISTTGVYSAVPTTGTATVAATSGSISGSAMVSVVNQAPTVATPASASPTPVLGNRTVLSVLGADDGGESGLTYSWATTGTPPAAVSFSTNGTNTAKNTTATFTAPGAYAFQVTITDASGLTTTSSVSVVVNQTLTSIVVSPGSALLHENQTQQFSASAYDQFGRTMSSQPTFTWSQSGAGSISGAGLYTSPGTTSAEVITAGSGSVTGNATVMVVNAAPTIATPASASPNPTNGTTTSLSVLGSDDGGEQALTYTWAATGTSPAPVSFAPNGNHGARNTTARFVSAGTYDFTVTVADREGDTTTSTVTVTVDQTPTSITVTPGSAAVSDGTTQAFTAAAQDQFGSNMASQPAFTWSVAGAGSVDAAGNYTAPAFGHGIDSLTATAGGVSGAASVDFADATPLIIAGPMYSPAPVTSTMTHLSIDAIDDGPTSDIIYAWSAIAVPQGAPMPTFSDNGTHSAGDTTMSVQAAGDYTLLVTVTNTAGGETQNANLVVTVAQTLSSISVAAAQPVIGANGTDTVAATGYDQFGMPMSSAPTFTWAIASGGGAVDQGGLYAAPSSATVASITASSAGISGNAQVTVVGPPAVTVPAPQATRQGLPLVFSVATGNAIAVSDSNTLPNVDTVQLRIDGGAVTLSRTTGLTFVGGNGAAGASMTFSGTPADINAALDGMVFTPASGFTGEATLRISATNDDQAAAGAQTGAASVQVLVEPVGTFVATPRAGLTTTSSGGTASFSVSLSERPTSPVSIGLLSSDPSAGTPDQAMLTFTPEDWNVPQQVSVIGHDADTGESTVSYQIALGSANSNDPAYAGINGGTVNLGNFDSGPIVTTSPGQSGAVVGGPPVVVDAGIRVSDPDNDLLGARLWIESGYLARRDVLSFTPMSGITSQWQAESGTLVLSGAASDAQYQAALGSVTFASTADESHTQTRTVAITLEDDGATSAPATRDVSLSAPVKPMIVAPAGQQTPQDVPIAFSATGQNGLAVYDPLPANATVQVTLAAKKGTVTLVNTNGLTFTVGDGNNNLTATFTGTLAAVNAALEGVLFTPYRGYSGDASLTVALNDLGNAGTRTPLIASTTVTIQVGAAPPHAVPPAATIIAPTPTIIPVAPTVSLLGTLNLAPPGGTGGGLPDTSGLISTSGSGPGNSSFSSFDAPLDPSGTPARGGDDLQGKSTVPPAVTPQVHQPAGNPLPRQSPIRPPLTRISDQSSSRRRQQQLFIRCRPR